MLEKDPDFYLKILGLNATSKNAVQVKMSGEIMTFFLNGRAIGQMSASQFYSCSVKDVWALLNVEGENVKDNSI